MLEIFMFVGSAIAELLKSGSDDNVRRRHSAVSCTGPLLRLSDLPTTRLSEAAIVDFRPPDVIFGRPEHAECLGGIVPRRIAVPERTMHGVGPGQLLGRTTILRSDGTLVVPDECAGRPASDYAHHLEQAIVDTSEGHVATAVYRSGGDGRVRISGPTLYIPDIEPGNFGSFIVRTLPFLLLVSDRCRDWANIILPTQASFFVDAIRVAMRGRPVRLFDARSIGGVIFDDLWTTQGGHPEGTVEPTLLDLFDDFAERATVSGCGGPSPERAYVSRRLAIHQKPGWRPLVNEPEIVEHLAGAGFEEVFLETLSLAEQIRVFRSARLIFAPSGSGITNSIWSRCARICEFESAHSCLRQHANLHSSSGGPYSFVFGRPLNGSPRDPMSSRINSPWRVEWAHVEAALTHAMG